MSDLEESYTGDYNLGLAIAEIDRLKSDLAAHKAALALLRRAAEPALAIMDLAFKEGQRVLPDYVAGQLAEAAEYLRLTLSQTVKPDAAPYAKVLEAAREYLLGEWNGIGTGKIENLAAWLREHRPDCKTDIALAEALAAIGRGQGNEN